MIIKLFEKYTDIKDVKETIFIKAIDTGNINVIKFFVNKGYDINGEKVLYTSSFDDKVFRYLLTKKPDIKINYEFRERMRNSEVQKALIDFNYGELIYKNVGFHDKLRDDPKYKNVVEMYEDAGKYNM